MNIISCVVVTTHLKLSEANTSWMIVKKIIIKNTKNFLFNFKLMLDWLSKFCMTLRCYDSFSLSEIYSHIYLANIHL